MSYKVCERKNESQPQPIKGLGFQRYESALKIAKRLSSIHQDIRYYILDTETKHHYPVTNEKGGEL